MNGAGPPRNGRGHDSESWPLKRYNVQTEFGILFGEIKRRDIWIERYLKYLTQEHGRLSGGGIGRHYLACIVANYREFRASGNRRDRYQSWVAIRLLCQWLAQLEKGNERKFFPTQGGSYDIPF